MTSDANTATAGRPGLNAVSFLHCFGSALNDQVQLHACATDGGSMPTGDETPALPPVRPITQADLDALSGKVRRNVVWWFGKQRLLEVAAAAFDPILLQAGRNPRR